MRDFGDRTRDQRVADDDLSEYAHRLEVRGAPRPLTWPDLCANCGGAAVERIRLRRAFYRRGHRKTRGRFGCSPSSFRASCYQLPLEREAALNSSGARSRR